jgi:antitoxin component YwqK of YwqJK toxin-antitoxin module
MRTLIVFLFTFPLLGWSQNDTINRLDENGRKQGCWIYFGKDRPESGYPAEGKIEEGNYLNDRKTGVWTKYHKDGVTVKIRGEYKNNRPHGWYETFYANGQLRRKGCFSIYKRDTLICDEYWYYESGILEHKRTKDSTIYYFPSGCLQTVMTESDTEDDYVVIHYSPDSCNVPLDTAHNQITRSAYDCKFIIREKSVCTWGTKGQFKTTEQKDPGSDPELAPLVTTPRTVGGPFKPNEHNRIMNEHDEIWQIGEFRNGRLYDGKVYIYDSDGILLKVKVFKKGQYYSDGQL